MSQTTFPLLVTARLELFQITAAHVKDIYSLFSDPLVLTYYNLAPFDKQEQADAIIDKLHAHYKNGQGIRWGIRFRHTTDLIGSAGFNNYSIHHRACIGYDLKPAYWNQGIMTEALNTIIEYGFTALEVNRIEAEVMPGNKASIQVLQKCDFKKEGLLRDWSLINGQPTDMFMFSLLKTDWCTP